MLTPSSPAPDRGFSLTTSPGRTIDTYLYRTSDSVTFGRRALFAWAVDVRSPTILIQHPIRYSVSHTHAFDDHCLPPSLSTLHPSTINPMSLPDQNQLTRLLLVLRHMDLACIKLRV